MSGKRKILARSVLPEVRLDNSLKKLDPALSGVRHDEVSIVLVLSFDVHLHVSDLGELVHVFPLDIKTDSASQHQHLECPREWTDGVVHHYKRAVLQGRKTKTIDRGGTQLPQEASSHSAFEIHHDFSNLVFLVVLKSASKLIVTGLDDALDSIRPLFGFAILGRSCIRSFERGVPYLTPWDKLFCAHNFLLEKAYKILNNPRSISTLCMILTS